MSKLKSNEDLVKNLMTISPYGALCQSFITTAIEEKCDQIIKHKEEILEQDRKDQEEGKHSLISVEAWVGIAEDIKNRMDEFYTRDSSSK